MILGDRIPKRVTRVRDGQFEWMLHTDHYTERLRLSGDIDPRTVTAVPLTPLVNPDRPVQRARQHYLLSHRRYGVTIARCEPRDNTHRPRLGLLDASGYTRDRREDAAHWWPTVLDLLLHPTLHVPLAAELLDHLERAGEDEQARTAQVLLALDPRRLRAIRNCVPLRVPVTTAA